MKQCSFYDTFVTTSDVIAIVKHIDKKQELFENIIKRFYDHLQNNTLQTISKNPISAFNAIKIVYYPPTSTTSLSLHEAQQKCKQKILAEYLDYFYQFANTKRMTIEQMSTLLSIAFFIFVESLERKLTSIDSYEIFKHILRVQVNLTNIYNMPMFNIEEIKEFDAAIQQYFYQFYSVYELRMTLYQEVNIYTYKPNEKRHEQSSMSDLKTQEDSNQNQTIVEKEEPLNEIKEQVAEQPTINPEDEEMTKKLLDQNLQELEKAFSTKISINELVEKAIKK